MKKLSLSIICLFFVIGCLTIPVEQRPQICQNNSKSLLYDTLKNPVSVDVAFQLSTTAFDFIKDPVQKKVALQTAIIVVTKTKTYLDQPEITYANFLQMLSTNFTWLNQYAGDSIIIITTMVSSLQSPLPIYPCDKYLFVTYLDHLLGKLQSKLVLLG
jgi:hypothetical protein